MEEFVLQGTLALFVQVFCQRACNISTATLMMSREDKELG